MKSLTIKIKSKKLLLIFLGIFIIFLLFLEFLSVESNFNIKVIDNEQRVLFINKLNLNIAEEPIEIKEIIIPEIFSNVFEEYNKIQLEAGYDLTFYKGKKAILYKYETKEQYGKKLYVNLIVFNGEVIGGDISSTNINGYMLPLKEYKIET